MVDHDLSNSEASSTCNENDYDAFQQLFVKSSKLDIAHRNKIRF